MIKLVFKILFSTITIGAIIATILFLLVGDDNFLGVFVIIGLIGGAIIAYFLRYKYIPRIFAVALLSIFAFIALLLITYGVYGFVFNKDMITGYAYQEMAGMIPYLAIVASLCLTFLSITISLFIKKKNS